MTIGELKKSLTRFPSDMDDTEVLFTFVGADDKPEYDNLAFVAYAEVGDKTILMLGSMKAALERMKKGSLRYADGTKPSETGFDLSDSK